MVSYLINDTQSNQRIDKFIRKQLRNAPLSFIYKLFRKKDVKVNNKHVDINYILKENDEVKVYISEDQLEDFKKNIQLKQIKFNHEIVYEDENILIINKPAGLLIHGDSKNKKETLTNDVLNYLYSKNEYNSNSLFTPAPAHRLDRNTSGLVIFGKNNKVLQGLMNIFKEKSSVSKEYITLVCGNILKDGEINKSLLKIENKNLVIVSDDEKAKKAITQYQVLKNYDGFTLLKVKLLTGRTHQIRVHMQYINHPIVGDQKYGNIEVNKKFKNEFNLNYQLLHSSEIQFYIDDAKYKVAGIIDTNYKKLLDSFLNSPVSDPSILRVEQNCEIEQGFWVNDSLYQKIKDNTTSDSFEGMFLKVDTKTIDNVLEYIKDNGLDLYFRMYTSYFTANNFYTLIKYLTFVISIILLIISSLIYFNYASYIVDVNQKTIDCLYSIGISKLDLSKIFLLNNLFMPLVTGIISLCAYYGLLYGVNFVHSREDILILNIWYAKVNYIVFLISLIVLIAVLLLIFERKLIRRADSKKVRR